MQTNINTNKRGFTLVELLIVIVVIAILAAISIVAYNGIQNRSKTSAGAAFASQVQKKVEAYNTARATGTGYPTYAELTATTSAVPEAQLDNPTAVVTYVATGTGAFNTAATYNDNKSVVYRQTSSTGACVYYWDFTGTPAQKNLKMGDATC